ncbi:MAG: 2-phosphosulfolactate phosphatase [Clostridia bacterium]|nr:2-phosphosulfolactate phosphatase [Clostridia bacterium]
MNIEILHMIEGAKKAKGTTVIIDVFRAFSVESYFFASGAIEIIPVGDVNLAYELKEKNPDFVLAGERKGKILPGFDVGNSPSDVIKLDCLGKTVVHTTSAGTQGIANAVNADEILGASLVNARATAEYIKNKNPENVSLVCMGLEALSQTEEDNLCALYIKSILEGTDIDLQTEIENLKYTSGAKFFDKAQNDVFPEEDFHLCTQVDKFSFVLKMTENGIMKKIDV